MCSRDVGIEGGGQKATMTPVTEMTSEPLYALRVDAFRPGPIFWRGMGTASLDLLCYFQHESHCASDICWASFHIE